MLVRDRFPYPFICLLKVPLLGGTFPYSRIGHDGESPPAGGMINPYNLPLSFIDLHKMREADDKAEKRDDLQETEDYGDEEDILDLRMPKEGGAKGGGRGKGKKRNRGRRAPRDKTRFRQS